MGKLLKSSKNTVVDETKNNIHIKSIIKQLDCIVKIKGNFEKNCISSPSINRTGLELACTSKEIKFPYIKSLVIWGTKESNFFKKLGNKKLIENSIKRVIKLKPPLLILCKGFEYGNLVLKIAKNFSSTIASTKLRSHEVIFSISSWVIEQLSSYSFIHGTVISVDDVGILIVGESGVGKSEVALKLLKNNAVFIGDDAILITNLGNRIVAKVNKIAGNFLEIRGIGLINVAQMFGITKIKETCGIDIVVTLVKAKDLEREYFERVGKKFNFTKILGVKVPNYRIPVTYGRDICMLIESAVADYKLKKYGYNSAKEFMKNYLQLINKK